MVIPTNPPLDRILYGLRGGRLIISAGRPSMGKTAFMLQLVRDIAKNNIPCLVFSLEMDESELTTRIISGEADINPKSIETGNLTQQQWTTFFEKSKEIKKLPIFIDASSRLSISEFKSKSHKYKREHGIKVIFVDYLQLMDGDPEFKNDTNKRMGSISRAGKQLSKDLNVPVIMLSQLNRAVESRSGSKVPVLSDLRDSGEIEQDADIVMTPYRPFRAGITEKDGVSTENDGEVHILKHRSGSLGVAYYHVSSDVTNWKEQRSEIDDFTVIYPDVNRNFEPKMKPNEAF